MRHLADHVIAERGVRHGRVVMVPTQALARTGRARRGKHAHGASHTERGMPLRAASPICDFVPMILPAADAANGDLPCAEQPCAN